MTKDEMLHYAPLTALVVAMALILTFGLDGLVSLIFNFMVFVIPGFALYWIVKWTFWPEEGAGDLPHNKLIKKWRNK
jgi:hypothetical protein